MADINHLRSLVEASKTELARLNEKLSSWFVSKKEKETARQDIILAQDRIQRAEARLAEILQAQSSAGVPPQSSMAGPAQPLVPGLAGSSLKNEAAGAQECSGAGGCSSSVTAGLNGSSILPDALGPAPRDLTELEKLRLLISGAVDDKRTRLTGRLVPCSMFPGEITRLFPCIDGVSRPLYFCENKYLRPIWRWGQTKIGGIPTYLWYNNQTKQFIHNVDDLPKMELFRDGRTSPTSSTRIFAWSPTFKKWQWRDIYDTGPYTSLPQLSYISPYTFLHVRASHCPVDDPYDLDHQGAPFTFQPPYNPNNLQIFSHFPPLPPGHGGKRKTKSRKHPHRKHKKSRRNRNKNIHYS
jgi:hypothetical protein